MRALGGKSGCSQVSVTGPGQWLQRAHVREQTERKQEAKLGDCRGSSESHVLHGDCRGSSMSLCSMGIAEGPLHPTCSTGIAEGPPSPTCSMGIAEGPPRPTCSTQ